MLRHHDHENLPRSPLGKEGVHKYLKLQGSFHKLNSRRQTPFPGAAANLVLPSIASPVLPPVGYGTGAHTMNLF
jgi:hypothetical protein